MSRRAYGDFQTPDALAVEVVAALRLERPPASVLEPTCGVGSLLRAAEAAFPAARTVGVDLDAAHLTAARVRVRGELVQANAFEHDWRATLASLHAPVLVLGNPPWVTTDALARGAVDNAPARTVQPALRGVARLTGAAGFDVAEWIVLSLLEAAAPRAATLAMIVKTHTARRVLAEAFARGLPINRAELRSIDARAAFGVAAEACLLVVRLGSPGPPRAPVFASLTAPAPASVWGFRDRVAFADADALERGSVLEGRAPRAWRSGLKHDASRIMELDATHTNGLGEQVDVEAAHVFPLCKASDVFALAHGRAPRDRFVLVPQRSPGERTEGLPPKLRAYLEAHAPQLDARKSRIYRGRPRFSVFGVGDYTFAPWKVAASAMHPRVAFAVVGPRGGRPVVLDDTCVFVPCLSEADARDIHERLTSAEVSEFLRARVFPGAKRPLTVRLLASLDWSKASR